MKKVTILLIMTSILIVLTGCKKECVSNNNKIRIGLIKGLLSVPYYFAEDEKIFEKFGIEVQLELYNSANDRDSAFKGNKIDAVSTDLVAALLYMNDKKDIVITSQTEEEFRLVQNKNLLYNSLSEIKHHPEKVNIGVSENTVIEYLADTIMKKNEISNYNKTFIPKVPDRYDILRKGDIDMAIMPEPFPSLIVDNGGKELWKSSDENLYATCFVVEKQFAESNYKVIKNLNLSINEAIEKMMSLEFALYQDIVIEHDLLNKEDLEVVSEQIFHPLVLPNKETFTDVLDWTKEKGLINNDYDLNDLLFPYMLENL